MKNRPVRPLIFVLLSLLLLACSLEKMIASGANATATVPAVPPPPPANTPAAPLPSPQPSPAQAEAQPALEAAVEVDPCSLITAAEAEAIFAEPAGPATVMSGACTISNAKDSLYMVSVTAAQNQQAGGILQGQAMLLGFAGGSLDEARMAKLKELAAVPDYKGFFTEVVAAAQGAPTLKARLVDVGGNDLSYWAWITAQSRRQGAFVAARGPTLVNINLIVADSQPEDAVLAAAESLAGKIFERLPASFTVPMPSAAPASSAPEATPTTIAVLETPTLIPTATLVGLPAPALIAPADGAVFNIYPRTTTLQWGAVSGAGKYILEVEACSSGKPSDCFALFSKELTTTSHTFNFVGSQPGQWRVWALDGNGQAGQKSAWWKFTYTR